MLKSVIYHQTEMVYLQEGSGKIPVIFIHGFGESGSIWKYQIEDLKKEYRLIIPDLPGSGKSVIAEEQINNMQFSQIEFYADCLHALLDKESIEKCFMFGHSMGGYILLAFMEKYPDKLYGSGFVHSTAFADNDEKKKNRRKGIKIMEQYGGYAFLKNTTPNLFSAAYKTEHASEIDTLIEEGKRFDTRALQHYYTAMMNRPDRTAVLKECQHPFLFVIGTDDPAVPLNDAQVQATFPKTVYAHTLQSCAHKGMWEHPRLVSDFLKKYISDVLLLENG
ncbi:MAG: alpha/beta hydrolase [Chitinophagaceae bacterium]|jgi:pimeloyl-ACP methyl ester carboxylesterase|nr:alpha/beta hydrolase [Chitinophagaceae bacterium]